MGDPGPIGPLNLSLSLNAFPLGEEYTGFMSPIIAAVVVVDDENCAFPPGLMLRMYVLVGAAGGG